MPLQKNQLLTLRIERLSSDGSGVAHSPEGEAVFVPGTAPGDEAQVRIVKDCGRYAFGILDKLLTPSPDRIPVDCAVAGPCGGCSLRHMDYAAELRSKQESVADAFRRIGGLDVPVLDAGVPSTLLTRRPDIRAAERNMAAANARIGVAQAAFFPSLTLNASVGYRGSSFAHLLTVPNRIWSVGPEVLATLLDGGARRAQVDVATANYQGTVAAYQQTVLAAFQAVEDNLSAQAILAEEENRQQAALNAARRAEQIAGNQYKAGTVGYLTVLNAQNQRIQAENALWNIRGRRYQATVGLIAGVGGQLVQPVS